MSVKSKHPGDIQKWIETIIDSCTSYKHGNVCRALIQNFKKQVNQSHPSTGNYLYIYPLEDRLSQKLINLK